jgi:prepilin-type N-terminal cleavage/methylation domain-containing protein
MGFRVARHASRRTGGFTLLELMIAVSVILVAVVSTFAAQISSHNLILTSRETNTAVADLQAAMERVLLRPADQIPLAGAANFPPGTPIAAFNDLHLANQRVVPTYPDFAGGAVPDPLEIVLTMSWNDHKGRPRTMRLASVKTR